MDEPIEYILGVDIGSTTIKAKVFDKSFKEHASTSKKVEKIYNTDPAAVEIDPIILWKSFVEIVKETCQNGSMDIRDIQGMGICVQRSNLMLWESASGKPITNLMSWQDTRCAGVVSEVNNSWTLKAANVVGSMLYFFLRQSRFLVMKIFKGLCQMASMKLYWLIKTRPELKEMLLDGRVLLGTLDSWLIWNLTKGELHMTDYTNAASTGMYDLFVFEWSQFMVFLTGIDIRLFAPTVCDTSGKLFETNKEIFGYPISVCSIVGDCSGSSFGLRCFNEGDVACTLGTGFFMQIITASSPKASIKGMYPQVGWRIGDEIVYVGEVSFNSFSVCIEWAKQIGLIDDVAACSTIARNAEDSDGLFFVPGFHGFSAPYQDPHSCAGFIGIKTTTTKDQMLRAVLEGLAFIVYDMYEVAVEESDVPIPSTIKVCGGVSRNDFLMELIASLTRYRIERSKENEMSLVGAVLLAGLGAGTWKNKDEIKQLPLEYDTFYPDPQLTKRYRDKLPEWKKAVSRFLNWYD